jgi:hypothetical protein
MFGGGISGRLLLWLFATTGLGEYKKCHFECSVAIS